MYRTGWIVTFVINERHGGSSSGYITSGFFGGLTVGRVVLLWVNKRVSYQYPFLFPLHLARAFSTSCKYDVDTSSFYFILRSANGVLSGSTSSFASRTSTFLLFVMVLTYSLQTSDNDLVRPFANRERRCGCFHWTPSRSHLPNHHHHCRAPRPALASHGNGWLDRGRRPGW